MNLRDVKDRESSARTAPLLDAARVEGAQTEVDDLPVWSRTEQVAERYQVGASTVRFWNANGRLHGVRNGKHTLYHRDELRRFDKALLDGTAG